MTLSPQRLEKAAEAARRDVDYDHPARRFLEPHEWTGIARAAISAYLGDDVVVTFEQLASICAESAKLGVNATREDFSTMLYAELTERDAG